ncbi:Phytochrome-like protein cph2 [Synechococcus sp. MIT S9509]|uniref:EAL domain-containing protein n=1 Tax=Synechococcus sp. MIT S9509 TaxID=1801630 RepID=UPI0007BBCCAB|nr:EAL domain-containing protein [Synechococcus sp. MIT S9509]KZR90121.1 Phytochrome-like protein cph2 [Synechococcus sp. MIT S9509]
MYDIFCQEELLLLANKNHTVNDRAFAGSHSFSRLLPTKISKFECEIELAADLDFAIQKQEFSLAYQPIYNSLHEIIWCEVLVRWQRKKDGELVPPEIFIPLAETNNKIHDIWVWSFETALAQLQEWRTDSYQLPKLSFNFSPSQTDFSRNTQFSYAEQIKNWCKSYNFSSRDFLIELTETPLLKDYAAAIDLFDDLKSIGVRLCLDDFGAGFSSLSMLRFLPVSTIKIDRSFLVGLPDSVSNRAIVKATIALASELGINVVAECVENEQQFRFLNNLGCDYFQGYFFTKQIASNVLEKLFIKN